MITLRWRRAARSQLLWQPMRIASLGQPHIQEKSGWRVAVEVIGRGVLQIKNTFSSVAGVVQIGRFLGSE